MRAVLLWVLATGFAWTAIAPADVSAQVTTGVEAHDTTASAQGLPLITGIVTTAAGTPLSGAEVSVPRFRLSAATRADGSYAIRLPESALAVGPITLTARLIGYQTDSAIVVLSDRAGRADFALAANPLQLGEVVVTGAGTATEVEKLGTMRDYIDSSRIIRSNEQNLVTALAAQVPNVIVTSASGDPASSSHIQIRGITSLESSTGQPLFVIDGVPVDNTMQASGDGSGGPLFEPNRLIEVNPSDVEKIEVLKGAAAGAIYGSRAGQGVILITTKKGRPGQTKYSLRSSWSLDQHTQLPRLQTEYGLGRGGETDPCVPSPNPALLNCEVVLTRSYGPRLPPGTPVYDHSGEVFQTGYTTDNTLSISGGGDRTQFFLSGGYSYKRGIVVGDDNYYRRISVRLNASHLISSRLKVGANVAYIAGDGGFVQSRNNVSGILLGAWRTPAEFNNLPYFDPVFGLHRSYRFPNPGPGSERSTRGYDNPFFAANESPATTDVSRTFGGLDAEWMPTDWLQLHETLGLDHRGDEGLKGWPWTSSDFGGAGGVAAGYIKNEQLDHNLTATLSYRVSPSWSGSVTLGQNLNFQTRQLRETLGIGLVAQQPFTLGNTAELLAPAADELQKVRLESYFAQVTADLMGLLYLTAAMRNDGGSTFGADRRRAWYPKASAALVFAKRPGGGLLTYGKLRAAYGQSGTQPAPYGVGGGFGPVVGGGLVSRGNRPLTTIEPERVKEFEAGVDLGLLGDKADLSVTHYRQQSTGVILRVPLPTSSGYLSELANAGRLRNRGWEASLNLRPVTTRTIAWEMALRWARNRGVTTALPAGLQFVPLPFGGFDILQGMAIVGQPIGVYYGTDYVRCGRGSIVAAIAIDAAPGECKGAPAGALYLQADGRPLIDSDRQYVLGDPNPDWTGSLRTDLRLGRVSIGGLLDIRHGGVAFNGTQGGLNEFGTGLNTAEGRNRPPVVFGADYYPGMNPTPVAGPGVGVPVKLDERWWREGASNFAGIASLFLEPGGWVKLREVSVAYTLNQPWVGRTLGFGSIELRLSGRNLVSWNSYSGVDPETSMWGAVTALRGFNYYNNPQTRSGVLTVTLSR